MSPEKLAAWLREPRLGTVLSLEHVTTVELARDAGWDWLWLDAEHGRFDEQTAAEACAVTQRNVPTFIRVPDKDETTLKRFLDAGADGLIVPQVSSVADVHSIANAALYPPRGKRSVGVARAQGYGMTLGSALREQNYCLAVQIETVEGVAASADIVSESAVDAVIVGPYDLSGSCGLPGDILSAQVQEGIEQVLEACKSVGKPCGIFAADAVAAHAYLQRGFRLVAVGIDAMMLAAAHRSMLTALRDTSSAQKR